MSEISSELPKSGWHKGVTMIRFFYGLVVSALLVVMVACGGGSRSSIRLVSLTIQSAGTIVPLKSTVNLTAIGGYSDGTTVNMTSLVTWSSSNPAVATVAANGQVTALSGGSTSITATDGTVTATVLLSIVPVGGTVQGAPLPVVTGSPATLAGSPGTSGTTNAVGAAARFNTPVGLTTDGKTLYVADSVNNLIRAVDIASASVSTLAGSGQQASSDGIGTAATFYHPESITCDGNYLYVAESQSGKIRRIDKLSGAVTTLVTSTGLTKPTGITTDGTYLYVSDSVDHVIRRVVIATGTVSIVAGTVGVSGSINAVGSAATFNQPVGITSDGISLFVNDFGSGLVRRIVLASGAVSTLASGLTTPATGITTDGTSLYVADYGNVIRRITISTGAISILASAGLAHPEGLTSDGINLFIADSNNHVLRRL